MEFPVARRAPEALIDLSVPLTCHIVGVGGPGMLPIARLLCEAGHRVTGSDLRDGRDMDELRAMGAQIWIGHDGSHVDGADVVVYSTAIPDTNVELVRAGEIGVRCCHRSVMLASLCASVHAIGVAGAHGKTTTSALLAAMLYAHFSIESRTRAVHRYIGGAVRDGDTVRTQQASPASWSRDDLFVIEADESDGTLEVLPLRSLIVTNIDVDHLDYYETFDNLKTGFVDVLDRVLGADANSVVVLNADDPHSAELRERAKGRCRTFGLSQADVHVVRTEPRNDGLAVHLSVDGVAYSVSLSLRGVHNALNVAAATAMATACGVPVDVALAAAEKFGGVERRFDERGDWNGALIVDDYAHLPAEIDATLSAARVHPRRSGKLVAVFQPNRYHRIAAMADEYGACFSQADAVVITDIYASGTSPIPGVTGEMVSNAVRAHHAHVVWAPTRGDVVQALRHLLTPGDVCVGMGCGDIATLADDLAGHLVDSHGDAEVRDGRTTPSAPEAT